MLSISSRLDIALACEADGVHLGGDAPVIEDVRTHAGGLQVGVSLHAGDVPPAGASYAFLSPVFATASKPGAAPVGLSRLARFCADHPTLPVYALGGIGAGQVRACRMAGAFGIAVRGGVLAAADVAVAARTMYAALVDS